MKARLNLTGMVMGNCEKTCEINLQFQDFLESL